MIAGFHSAISPEEPLGKVKDVAASIRLSRAQTPFGKRLGPTRISIPEPAHVLSSFNRVMNTILWISFSCISKNFAATHPKSRESSDIALLVFLSKLGMTSEYHFCEKDMQMPHSLSVGTSYKDVNGSTGKNSPNMVGNLGSERWVEGSIHKVSFRLKSSGRSQRVRSYIDMSHVDVLGLTGGTRVIDR